MCAEERLQNAGETAEPGASVAMLAKGGENPLPPLKSPAGMALATLVVVDLGFKTVAIARALRRGDKKWILPLAVLNTVGILPTVYLVTHRDGK